MKRLRWLCLALFAFCLLAFPMAAMAQAPVPGPGTPVSVPDGPAAQWVPLYLLVLSSLAPLVGYLINHFGPHASEQAKGVAQGALAAGVAVLYQAVTPGNLGLNSQTLLAVVTSMAGSLAGHIAWKQAGINTMLGAGVNANGKPSKSVVLVGNKPKRRRSG